MERVALARVSLDTHTEHHSRDYGGREWPDTPPQTCAHSRSGAVVVQISDNVDDFAGVWPRLADLDHLPHVRSYPFQCRDHLQIWQETIGTACKVRPIFVNVSDETGSPLLMMPFGIRQVGAIRTLTFLDEGIADYNAPVLYRAATELSEEEMSDIWDAICRASPAFDVVKLEKVPASVADFRNPLVALTRKAWPLSGHFVKLRRAAGDEPLQSKHTEKENRRCRKRLAEIGVVSFNVATGGDASRVFDIFVRQKLQRYRETIGIDDFDVPGQQDYYFALTQRLLGKNVQLFWLAVGEEIIATAWCLCAGRRFYYMMCGSERNDRWRSFSPGRLLLDELVKWAGRNGFEIFDFGIGDEDYKLRWSQAPLPLFSLLRPRTRRGRVWCTVLGMRNEVKQRLPRSVVALGKRMLGHPMTPLQR